MSKEVLREVLVFRDLLPYEIAEIEDLASEEGYSRDEVIFQEGDPGDALFVVASGEVRISRYTPTGIEKVFTRLGPKNVFGEMSLLDGKPRSAGAIADTKCALVRIAKDDIDELINNNSIAAYKVIHAFARTLSYRLRKMNDELLDFFADPDKTINQILKEKDEEHYLFRHSWSVLLE